MKTVVIALVLSLFALVAVAQAADPPDQVKAVADRFFTALIAGDFTAVTKDFDAKMTKALPPEAFKQNQEMNIAPVIGDYVSRKFNFVEEKDGAVIYHFAAVFSKDTQVDVKFVFMKDDKTYKIAGLWFDSPKLRAAKEKGKR